MAEVGPQPTAEDKARYETLKNELKKTLSKKRAVDKQLVQIETQIFTLESTYFAETAAHNGGNIVQGFENYLKNQTTARRKNEINDHDRLFSRSSLTYTKSLDLANDGDDSTMTGDDFNKSASGMTPSSSMTTVLLPPATRTQEISASAQLKKLRDKEYQRQKRARMRGQRDRDAEAEGEGESEDEIISAATTSSRRPNKRARLADDE